MIRFPNPKSDPISLRDFFREAVYSAFAASGWPAGGLKHDDFSKIAASRGGVTSGGQIGTKALESSTRQDRSLDPMFNQMKMLTELYRLLGWLMPVREDHSHFLITPFGRQAAAFVGANLDSIGYGAGTLRESDFWERCVLGICFPHPHVDANDGFAQRTFLLILILAEAVGGLITRDELILTALRVTNDRDMARIDRCVDAIASWRSTNGEMVFEQARTDASHQIKGNTQENYTRFPMAIIEGLGWFEKVKVSQLASSDRLKFENELGKNGVKGKEILRLTDKGRIALSAAQALRDVRKEDLPEASDADLAVMAILIEACRTRRVIDEQAGAMLAPGAKVLQRMGINVLLPSGQLSPLPILFEPFQQLPSRVLMKVLQIAKEGIYQ